MLAVEDTSMGDNRAQALQGSFHDAMVKIVHSCTQQDFLTAFQPVEKHHSKLYDDFSKVLQSLLSYSEAEFADVMEDSQLWAKLREIDSMCQLQGSSAGGMTVMSTRLVVAPHALAARETVAAKLKEKEHLQSILENVLEQRNSLLAQLDKRKAEAATLAEEIAAIGDEHNGVQGRDSRWKSRRLLSN